ncbi:autotransporter outer membrane beta-barrel domain-containing protein, partial [Morganella morganii]|nr:autotransporter outer membrane beta-barrel domain-containing protein [Morganella morganii]
NMFVDNAYWEGDIITKTENSLADIELLNDSVWKGSAKYYQDNKGGIVNLKLNGESARWVMTSSSTISNLELKNGEVYLGSADSVAGNRLFIDGNYAGASEKDKATIIFNTVLGADNSLSDKMIVNGNTSGHTMVSVRNLGGQGDATLNGIELISVTGLSDGVFEKKGRIVAGAYDYDLIKKDSN